VTITATTITSITISATLIAATPITATPITGPGTISPTKTATLTLNAAPYPLTPAPFRFRRGR
jgi:hypothetical protein